MSKSLDELIELRKTFDLGWMERNMITIDVHGGMCKIEFTPDLSTGTAKRGVGFELIGEKPTYTLWKNRFGQWRSGGGVMTREDATRLRDMLTRYLEHIPCGGESTEGDVR